MNPIFRVLQTAGQCNSHLWSGVRIIQAIVILGALFLLGACQSIWGEQQTVAKPTLPTPTQRSTRRLTATPVPRTRATPTQQPQASTYPPIPIGLASGRVVAVVDGDTVDVRLNGVVERIRLIGINTPESKDPRRPVQCFGREASAEATRLLQGQMVQFEPDASQDRRDQYGRLLGYLWLPDGKLVNLELVRGGFAHEYTYNQPYKYQRLLRTAERQARQEGAGFWSATTCNGNTDQAA